MNGLFQVIGPLEAFLAIEKLQFRICEIGKLCHSPCKPAAHDSHATLLVSCGSFTHIEAWVCYICVLHLNLKTYFRIREKDRDNAQVSL